MKRVSLWIQVVWLMFWAVRLHADSSPKLLDVTALTAEVNQLSHPPANLQGVQREKNAEQREKDARRVQHDISEFIVRQWETMPSISGRLLETQLRRIFGAEPWDVCHVCDNPPHVYALDWGPNTTKRAAIVAYSLSSGFMGPHGNTTVIESYLWENGKARLVASGGREFDAHSFHTQQVAWYTRPYEYSVLVWGQMINQNGRCISGKAAVYRVTLDSVSPVWQSSPAACNLSAHANSLGWEVDYGDRKLVYGDDPHPRFFDVYAVDSKGLFHLFLSKRY